MKLIYTGINGSPVRFGKGVDTGSRDVVRAGEEIVAIDEKVAKSLLKQGVCVPAEESKAEPERPPIVRRPRRVDTE